MGDEDVASLSDSNPRRLPLDAVAVRRAREAGAEILIDTDAQGTEGSGYIRYSVRQARLGGTSRWTWRSLPVEDAEGVAEERE